MLFRRRYARRSRRIFRRATRVSRYRRRNYGRRRTGTVRSIVQNMAEKKRFLVYNAASEVAFTAANAYSVPFAPPSGTGLGQRVGTKCRITSVVSEFILQQRVADPLKDPMYRVMFFHFKDTNLATTTNVTPSNLFYDGVDAPGTDIALLQNICAIPNTDKITVLYDYKKMLGDGGDGPETFRFKKRLRLKGEVTFATNDAQVREVDKALFFILLTTNTGNNNRVAFQCTTQYRYIDI